MPIKKYASRVARYAVTTALLLLSPSVLAADDTAGRFAALHVPDGWLEAGDAMLRENVDDVLERSVAKGGVAEKPEERGTI